MQANREMLRVATGYDGKTPRPRYRLDKKERVLEKIPRVARDAIHRCAIGQSPWPLVLLGEHGAGKSCAALYVLDRYGGPYWTASEWAERVRDAEFGRLTCPGSGYPMSLRDVRAEWVQANLGVIDELGFRSKSTDHEAECLHWAVDRREGRPLILISNRTLVELGTIYEAGLASRMSAGTIVTLKGDQRIQHAAPGGRRAEELR